MASIREALEQIMDIDGALGTALVDYDSGMTLGTLGGGDLDMELAGAGVTEVVRKKRQTIGRLGSNDRIEDILITLESQYHLVRIFHKNESVFTYVVLDKAKANLALARLGLKAVDEALEI